MANEPQNEQQGNVNNGGKKPPQREIINRTAASMPDYACVIEIADSRNGSVLWPITQSMLRGKWAQANIPAASMPEKLQGFPDMPGIHIAIDSRRRAGTVFDLLSRKSHESLLKEINDKHERIWGCKCQPDKDINLRNMTDDQIKNWFYWIRRMLDSKQCVCVEGTVPSMTQIEAMPGKYSTNQFDASVHVKKDFEKSPYPYVAPVLQDFQKRQSDLVEEDGQTYFQKAGVVDNDDDDLLDE